MIYCPRKQGSGALGTPYADEVSLKTVSVYDSICDGQTENGR